MLYLASIPKYEEGTGSDDGGEKPEVKDAWDLF